MSEFKLGDEVEVLRHTTHGGYIGMKMVGSTGVITFKNSSVVRLDGEGYRCSIKLTDIKLVTKYPNPPRPWMHERIEHAKGANIQFQYINAVDKSVWNNCVNTTGPLWEPSNIYRVEPTEKELQMTALSDRIAKRIAKTNELELKLNALQAELDGSK